MIFAGRAACHKAACFQESHPGRTIKGFWKEKRTMYKITLINMPFANLGLPSIALTQLKSVLDAEFSGQISVEVLYLSHDFAKYFGIEFYDFLTNSMESFNTGLGDWIFQQLAFPN